jgi:hypothetical protein
MNKALLDRYYSKLRIQLIVLCTAMACMMNSGFAQETHRGEQVFPFYPGEKLTFQLRWGFIPAGEAVLEVFPLETVLGVESFHFVMTARTYPLIDLFYEVRDRVDAYTDKNMTHSILYRKKQREGKTRRDVLLTFNWEKQEAQYSNFGKTKKPISILPGSFDPLSVFYAFRLHNLEENPEIEVPVTDGKKAVIGKASVIKREKIKIGMGTYDTYLVEPELKHIGGVFEKSKDAKLKVWVTADDRQMPVLIKSKVVIGSVIAELIAVSSGPDSELTSDL